MTPTELQALMDREGVPVEARAEPHESENAHVGAMVKWLLIRDTGIEFYYPSLGEGYTVIVASRGNRRHVASTLTEALAHACGQIHKQRTA